MANRLHILNILVLIVVLCGCEHAPAVPEAVLRLTRDTFERSKNADRPPLLLPLRPDRVSADAPGVETTEDVLRLPARDKLSLRLDIAAERYNALRVTMRVDRGGTCTFGWAGDIVPSFGQRHRVSGVIIPDNEFHTYTLPLGPPQAETWAGRIQQIVFLPSNEPANVEIASMELIWRTPEGPTRITIQDETHEALFGTQPTWEFVVPDDAEFEVHLGMLGSSWWKASTDGVRFKATIDAESAQDVILVDQTVEPMKRRDHRSWLSRRADLSSFAGERVRINLTIDNLGTSDNDFAYWGDPAVFTRSQRRNITPVILISCDTLRADHLSCYGYSRETTPHLDAFAKESALFENAISAEPWTLPAHVSMLTGLYPKNHGVTSDVNPAEGVTTLAEVLSETGYLTAGFTGHGIWLLPQRGFSHGSDTYSAP